MIPQSELERVARAIAEAGVKLTREGCRDPKVVVEAQARAAIEAIHGATEVEAGELIERLSATKTQTRVHGLFEGALAYSDGETREVPINPDGPDAADLIERLLAQPTPDNGDIRNQASFLLERIAELDWSSGWDEFAREWHGHVEPAIARLRDNLKSHKGK